jgi:hypothetical protein
VGRSLTTSKELERVRPLTRKDCDSVDSFFRENLKLTAKVTSVDLESNLLIGLLVSEYDHKNVKRSRPVFVTVTKRSGQLEVDCRCSASIAAKQRGLRVPCRHERWLVEDVEYVEEIRANADSYPRLSQDLILPFDHGFAEPGYAHVYVRLADAADIGRDTKEAILSVTSGKITCSCCNTRDLFSIEAETILKRLDGARSCDHSKALHDALLADPKDGDKLDGVRYSLCHKPRSGMTTVYRPEEEGWVTPSVSRDASMNNSRITGGPQEHVEFNPQRGSASAYRLVDGISVPKKSALFLSALRYNKSDLKERLIEYGYAGQDGNLLQVFREDFEQIASDATLSTGSILLEMFPICVAFELICLFVFVVGPALLGLAELMKITLKPEIPKCTCLCGQHFAESGYRKETDSMVFYPCWKVSAEVMELACPTGKCVLKYVGTSDSLHRQTSHTIVHHDVLHRAIHAFFIQRTGLSMKS